MGILPGGQAVNTRGATSRGAPLRIMGFFGALVCGLVLSLAAAYLYLDPQIPRAETYRQVRLETPLRVFTADGQLMAEFGERRLVPVKLTEVPPLFIRAVLDTEDKRFYEHSGVDFITLVNSALELVLNMGEITRGGSTITMQLPRNLGTFSLDRVFIRKFKEILLAIQIERALTKDEILELYVNAVPFGKRAYGAQAAALTYYGRTLDQLNLAQLAMLAGIPQAPTAGNPVNNPERALRRRNQVLDRMLDQGSITPQQHAEAVAAPNTATLHQRKLDVASPYPSEWVRQELEGKLPDLYSAGYEVVTTIRGPLQAAARAAVQGQLIAYDRRHGYRGPESQLSGDRDDWVRALARTPPLVGFEAGVVTDLTDSSANVLLNDGREVEIALATMTWARPYLTVDSRGPVPARPADILSQGDLIRVRDVPADNSWHLGQVPEVQGALASLDPQSGAVLALEGGSDFSLMQFNHALQAARQPGSGFKPFVYSAAIEYGLSPASVFMDAPLVFGTSGDATDYRPSNDDRRYNGPTRLREALYRSINLVTMRVMLEIGPDRLLEHLARFGFDTRGFPRNTQLAIGGGTVAVTPMQMATAYAVFANGGYRVEPWIVDHVRDLEGREVYRTTPRTVCKACAPDAPDADLHAPRVLDARIAFVMTTMLRDVVQRGTGRRALALGRGDLGGKTGTTNEAADTWFNGFSPDVVASAWVGFPAHAPLGAREYGSSTPLPIWIDYMRVALADRPEVPLEQPPGLVTLRIDTTTGAPAPPGDRDAPFEYFLEEHAPAPPPTATTPTVSDTVVPTDIF
ncbi:MAG: penicillin-binding protein 1A [Pseudomonadales bacterium]